MPHRRSRNRGSFAGHFDELVNHFGAQPQLPREESSAGRPRKLQEKIDIHGLLFERAWQLDEDPSAGAR